jgi:hypothetical protein
MELSMGERRRTKDRKTNNEETDKEGEVGQ